jgi:hypothetical protein
MLRASRSSPAQATIAPLSVQSSGGGMTSGSRSEIASSSIMSRIERLAATPPATTSALGCTLSSRSICTAVWTRSAMTSVIAA